MVIGNGNSTGNGFGPRDRVSELDSLSVVPRGIRLTGSDFQTLHDSYTSL